MEVRYCHRFIVRIFRVLLHIPLLGKAEGEGRYDSSWHVT